MDHDVELADVGRQCLGEARDREVAEIAVAPAVAQLGGDVLEPVVLGIERIDLREGKLAAAGHLERGVELAALEHRLEDAERRRPRRDRHRRARAGERLGDREPETAVVGHAGDERALAREIDLQHGRVIARIRHVRK